MLLSRVQRLIGAIYDVSIAHDIYDFLVTDRRRLPAAARSGSAEEELIVAQGGDDRGEVGVSLYLDAALLERLARENPLVRLHAGNVADWCTALEGVSHFLYLAWNAGHDRPVSLLELEMQAEIDKYVASYWLLRRQSPGHFPAELRRVLFARSHVDPALPAERAAVYREASRYAEKFCRRIERTLSHRLSQRRLRRGRNGGDREVLAELRRFYRLTHSRKRALIDGLA
jgi:hypothetical protein